MRVRWWHWVLGTYLIIVIWLLGTPVFLGLTPRLVGEGQPWQQLAKELSAFIPFAVATPLVWRYLLKRPFGTLITDAGSIRWTRIAQGGVVWFAIALLSSGFDFLLNADAYRWTFDPAAFIPFVVIALTLLPIQTSAEEFFFRGWLMRWASSLPPVAVVSISGAVFALPHLANPEAAGHELPALAAWFILGAGWAYTAVRDRGIELALGAHFANNFFSVIVIGYSGAALPTSALATTGEPNIETTAIALAIAMAVFIAVTRPRT